MNHIVTILKSLIIVTTDVTVAMATTITNQTPALSKAVAAARDEFMKAAGEEKLHETFAQLLEATKKYEGAVESCQASIKKSLAGKGKKSSKHEPVAQA